MAMIEIKTVIQQLINENQWEKAEELLQQYIGNNQLVYDDVIAIFEASIAIKRGLTDYALDCIRRGLKYNVHNYELYYMMGNVYEAEGKHQQAYLCYENSVYQCNNQDKEYLIKVLRDFKEKFTDLPKKVAIVILTYNNLDYTKTCINSIRLYNDQDTYELIVVDNASTDGTVDWLKNQTDIKLIVNDKNQGFPAGCNQGIALAAQDSDIMLLNNDTVVLEHSIFTLRMGIYSDEKIALAGSTSNNAARHQMITETYKDFHDYQSYASRNNISDEKRYERVVYLMGFALLFKRQCLNEIGNLDERFSPGNFEDNDICIRILLKGYHLLLCKDSFIYHFGSKSFKIDSELYKSVIKNNRHKFQLKWEMDAWYFSIIRNEILQMINKRKDEDIKVLEVGCACGATLLKIQNEYPNSTCYGIELNSMAAKVASCNFDIKQGNIETMVIDYPENYFDYIIFADVLEHLYNPEEIICRMKKYLKVDGHLLASIPNIMHYSVLIPLLQGNFTYREEGILDKTHLRFFTWNEIKSLLDRCGYSIDYFNYKFTEPTVEEENMINQLSSLAMIGNKEEYKAYQYLVSAIKKFA